MIVPPKRVVEDASSSKISLTAVNIRVGVLYCGKATQTRKETTDHFFFLSCLVAAFSDVFSFFFFSGSGERNGASLIRRVEEKDELVRQGDFT